MSEDLSAHPQALATVLQTAIHRFLNATDLVSTSARVHSSAATLLHFVHETTTAAVATHGPPLASSLSRAASLAWLWPLLPFPPVFATYAIIVALATSLVVVASRAAARRPLSAGDPDPTDKLYYHVSDSAKGARATDAFDDALKELVTKRRARLTDDTTEHQFEMAATRRIVKELRALRHERVSASEASLMPVFGAVALLGLYFAYKYFSAASIQKLMSGYFALMAFFSVVASASLAVQWAARSVIKSETDVPHWRLTLARDPDAHAPGIEPGFDMLLQDLVAEEQKAGKLTRDDRDLLNSVRICDPVNPKSQFFSIYCSLGDLLGVPMAAGLLAIHYYWPSWVSGNILAAAVAVQGIVTVRLDSVRTGLIMLAGLFAYDIYFVFGTDVMVTVATQLQVPIKLEVPRPDDSGSAAASLMRTATAMLGLGDIVVPALFLSMLLRFDMYSFYAQHEKESGEKLAYAARRPVPAPYFSTGVVAYVIGLVVTIGFMHVYKAGQPALLYLCPAIAAAALGTAAVRGELGLLFAYRDHAEEDVDETKDKNKKKKKDLEGPEYEAYLAEHYELDNEGLLIKKDKQVSVELKESKE
ncbi:uncharacterized protein SAPINGB_P004214 [Magnusiomyces paraingens]|uniref:Signal peptide peptidase n=1 Tax=Magnusiomyces paraingens TaxID=2606893 RepID=A0A5E8BTD3_9ASCO|nr:uncharacterized protein SAPINGB_P004214 [Saprochaete ingens]VVT54713.1 unnamed protein product [Saprochaete ingens]